MRLNPIRANMNELVITHTRKILFSYSTPVAGYDEEGAFRTEEFFSRTTTSHINQYLLDKDNGRVVPQEYIESLLEISEV